ncbi:MAG TPA: Gfo/Idh/MocA family oxidoreductase [Chromatiaceae bacterium]|nr:Gfo/Idh/MocA family oxidoreductase [Chromatiaceae bacterium]
MADKLRFAVIGVGYLGRFHALIYSRLPDVALVGVVDTDPERARAVAQEAGCAVFASLEDVASQVDAVSVVVPTTAHLAVAEPLLRRGIHMLLEKPIAATREEGKRIVDLADQGGAILQIGHLERFNAGVMALAEHIDHPRFVEIQRMGEFVERATDVDVVSDLMIHDIDIILSLMGSELQSVSAVGTPVLTNRVDIANARLEFANGAVANVVASRVSDRKTRRIRVFQERKYLSLDFIEQTIDIAYPHLAEGATRPEIVRERIQVVPAKPLDREIEAFVACVRERRRPLVDGRVGLEALDVALKVRDCMGH